MAARLRPVLRARGVFANLRGFKLTLEASQTEIEAGDSVDFKASFNYRQLPVPEADIHLYVDEKQVSEARTGLDGTATFFLAFNNAGTYTVIARYESPLLVVESNPVTITVKPKIVTVTFEWEGISPPPLPPAGQPMPTPYTMSVAMGTPDDAYTKIVWSAGSAFYPPSKEGRAIDNPPYQVIGWDYYAGLWNFSFSFLNEQEKKEVHHAHLSKVLKDMTVTFLYPSRTWKPESVTPTISAVGALIKPFLC